MPSFFQGIFLTRDRTSALAGEFFTTSATWEVQRLPDSVLDAEWLPTSSIFTSPSGYSDVVLEVFGLSECLPFLHKHSRVLDELILRHHLQEQIHESNSN